LAQDYRVIVDLADGAAGFVSCFYATHSKRL